MRKRTSLLLLIAVLFTGGLFANWWFNEFNHVTGQPVNAWLEDQQADCAIVLTGGPNRLSEGFDLLYQNKVKKLIISGVNPGSHIEEIYPNIIFYGAIESESIILEKNSKTTYGNAQQTLPLVEALQCRDVILITSNLHMYRSYHTFRAHYPESLRIYPRGTVGKSYQPALYQAANESLKSLFYSLWAY